MARKRLFVVMKLERRVIARSLSGEETQFELSGCAGYIPVFETLEEAQKHNPDGRYEVLAIEIPVKPKPDEKAITKK